MLKKITYSFLFFLVLQLVLFSCCKAKTFLVNLQSLQIYNAEDTVVTTSEDFYVNLNLIYDYQDITSATQSNINFNTALATTCPDNNYEYGSEFTNLNITANTTINGIAAGESLNDIMRFTFYDFENLLEINQFYNPETYQANITSKAPDSILLVFNETIASGSEFALNITIETSNEATFSVTTNNYVIE